MSSTFHLLVCSSDMVGSGVGFGKVLFGFFVENVRRLHTL